MSQVATFKLKCVQCQTVETRPAGDCVEQPFCNKPGCYGLMVLVEVSIREEKKGKRKK